MVVESQFFMQNAVESFVHKKTQTLITKYM